MAGTKHNQISDADLKKALDKCFVITPDELTLAEETDLLPTYSDELPPGAMKDEVDREFARRHAEREREVREFNDSSDESAEEKLAKRIAARLEAGEPLNETEIRVAGLAIDVPFAAPPPSDGPIIRYASGKTLQEVLREKYPKMFERDSSA